MNEEGRLLVLLPFGRDAELIDRMLQADGIASRPCSGMAELVREAERGAAAVLVGEEALGADTRLLIDFLERQPPWSDLPVLVLTRTASDPGALGERLGNVTLIERPVRVAALRSSVRTALRARERQYQTRAHLREREEENRRKDEFLAMLAHELRNPLAPIRNTISILRLSGGRQPAGQLYEMMERQVGHMVRLVDDLLEVSRITRGKIGLRRENVDLSIVIASAVETSRPLIEAGGHRLSVELPGERLLLHADATRLAQVFANLLNNAAKFTPAKGDISLRVAREGDMVLVRVRDSGLGMPPEVLPRIFDMFWQGRSSDAAAPQGLGIGLTLAKALVEMHGGTIAPSSDGPGRGSTFTVCLPLAGAARATSCEPAAQPIHAARRRVLVVDDNHDAAESLGALLKVLGADVEVVDSGERALETIERYRPEIVFLDLGMPGMDGYEVARRIRRRGDWRDVRLVALTGWGQEKDRRLSSEAGFDHHLVKPADVGALQAVLAAG